jgi:molybdopterin-biosynthesis enzyme MoeA-like protein
MNSEVSKILTDNLSRMGVSINHIYYINDMLKGLNDKIRADKENVDNGFLYLIRD